MEGLELEQRIKDVIGGMPASTGGAVRGRVSASGAVLAGRGFAVAHTATGIYTITFTPGFSTVPWFMAYMAAPNGGTGISVKEPQGSVRTPTQVVVIALDTGFNAVDAAFDFEARGLT